jgi:hypothetical protein
MRMLPLALTCVSRHVQWNITAIIETTPPSEPNVVVNIPIVSASFSCLLGPLRFVT